MRKRKKKPMDFDPEIVRLGNEILEKTRQELYKSHWATMIPMYAVDVFEVHGLEGLGPLLEGFLSKQQTAKVLATSFALFEAVVKRVPGDNFEKAGREIEQIIPAEHLEGIFETLSHARQASQMGHS